MVMGEPEKQKILLVDDQKMNLLLHAGMLKDLDVEILETTHAAEAIELAASHDLALVLLDVQMPKMDGFEVARQIQAVEGRREIPIIFITGASANPAEVFEGYAAGAVDYLVKPVEPVILRSKAKFFCELKRREMVIRRQAEEIQRKNRALEREIAERHQVEEERQESEVRYRTFVELCPDAIAVQTGGRMVYFNTSLMRLLGASERDELAGRGIESFASPGCKASFMEHLHRVERQGGTWDAVEASLVRLDGGVVDVEARCGCMLIEGEMGVQVALQDVTERKRLEKELRRMTIHDGLTGVANRRHFDEVLEREWRRAARNGEWLAVIMADIDHFKQYNDQYGHLVGDDCLCMVAKALERSIHRSGDLLARYGGEEFAVVLTGTDTTGAVAVAERMRRETMVDRLDTGTGAPPRGVSISVGVAAIKASPDGNPGDLVAAADRGLYAAKAAGRNCVFIGTVGETTTVKAVLQEARGA